MTTISFHYRKADETIIATVGAELEAGQLATAFNGTDNVDKLPDADALTIAEDVAAHFQSDPDSVGIYFLLRGGQLNTTNPDGFEKILTIELDA